MKLTDQQLQNFWSKVIVGGDDDCWVWTGATQSKGYGSFSINGRTHSAHRVSFALASNRDPGDCHVLHECDNRKCVNPNHLFEGTNLDNVRDMHAKGRANMSGLKYSGVQFRNA